MDFIIDATLLNIKCDINDNTHTNNDNIIYYMFKGENLVYYCAILEDGDEIYNNINYEDYSYISDNTYIYSKNRTLFLYDEPMKLSDDKEKNEVIIGEITINKITYYMLSTYFSYLDLFDKSKSHIDFSYQNLKYIDRI